MICLLLYGLLLPLSLFDPTNSRFASHGLHLSQPFSKLKENMDGMLVFFLIASSGLVSCQCSLAPINTFKKPLVEAPENFTVDNPMTFSWMIVARRRSNQKDSSGCDGITSKLLAGSNDSRVAYQDNGTLKLINKQSKTQIVQAGDGEIDSMENWDFKDTKISLERIIETIMIQKLECEIWIYSDCCYAGNMARNLGKLKAKHKDISIYAARKPEEPSSPLLSPHHHRGDPKSIIITGERQHIDFGDLLKTWGSSQNNGQTLISGHRLHIFEP